MIRWSLILILAVAVVGAQGPRTFDENTDDLPPGCDAIAGDEAVTVRAGRVYAEEFPGRTFTFDQHEFDYPACTRVTVTFVNEDNIRHQFMVHGVYPNGTTLLEVTGPGQVTGTFILPAEADTILFHCGIPTHQQQGMKGQILVAGGEGDLPNIPGISGLPVEGEEAPGLPLLPIIGLLALLARHRFP